MVGCAGTTELIGKGSRYLITAQPIRSPAPPIGWVA
jgi:hypothetical protein